jgi:hypothetical protein
MAADILKPLISGLTMGHGINGSTIQLSSRNIGHADDLSQTWGLKVDAVAHGHVE